MPFSPLTTRGKEAISQPIHLASVIVAAGR